MMELELRQETVRGWETVCRTTLEQEETAEAIVPDARPDHLAGAGWPGPPAPPEKRNPGRPGELAGLLKTTILYQPEGGQGVEAMEVTLPFSAAPDLPRLTRRGTVHVVPRVLSVDVHLLNPRKVLVRVGYCLDLEAFEPQNRSLAAQAADPEQWGICQKTGQLRTLQTVYVQEKAFTYQDTLALPAGRPDAVEVLRTQAKCTCTEARVIGTKLVFKGEAALQLLCRGEDGGLFAEEFHLPYSQIMDAGEESEEGLCHMDLVFTDVTCTPGGGGPAGTFQVTLALQAKGFCGGRSQPPFSPTSTAPPIPWRPQRPCTPSAACWTRERPRKAPGRRWRPAACPAVSWTSRCAWARLTQNLEGEDRVLTQEAELSVLYETEEGPAAASRRVSLSHRLPGQGEGTCLVTTELLRDPTAALAGEGVEVSFALAFRWMCLTREEVPVITQVQVGEPRQAEGRQPSLTLREVHPGEDLWAVAKACCTTEDAILAASGLESGEVAPGQMLLIPCKSR